MQAKMLKGKLVESGMTQEAAANKSELALAGSIQRSTKDTMQSLHSAK